jgi:hypothetical protein
MEAQVSRWMLSQLNRWVSVFLMSRNSSSTLRPRGCLAPSGLQDGSSSRVGVAYSGALRTTSTLRAPPRCLQYRGRRPTRLYQKSHSKPLRTPISLWSMSHPKGHWLLWKRMTRKRDLQSLSSNRLFRISNSNTASHQNSTWMHNQ